VDVSKSVVLAMGSSVECKRFSKRVIMAIVGEFMTIRLKVRKNSWNWI